MKAQPKRPSRPYFVLNSLPATIYGGISECLISRPMILSVRPDKIAAIGQVTRGWFA